MNHRLGFIAHNLDDPEESDETIFEMDAMIFTASQAGLYLIKGFDNLTNDILT